MANGIFGWSTTPASNATQDGINFSEGQAPSTVNDSARALMSSVAKLLDDIGGVASSSGSANAQTVATATGLTSYATGIIVSFKAGYTNSSAATLNADGVGAKSVYLSGATLAGGEIVYGAVHVAIYDEALDSAAGGWHLLNPGTMPVSAITSGTINGAVIGGTTPAAITGTDIKSTQGVTRGGIISPSQITASQNNYAPTGFDDASVLRLSLSAAWSLTGLVAPTTNPDGREMRLLNISAYALTLVNESASSTAANRFTLPGDMVIPAYGAIDLIYDGTSSRWRCVESAQRTSANLPGSPTTTTQTAGTANTTIATTAFTNSSGRVLGQEYAEYTTYTALTAVLPDDNTVPLISEGTQVASIAYTPTVIGSRIVAEFVGFGSGSSDAVTGTAALFADSTCIGASPFDVPYGGGVGPVSATGSVVTASLTAITFSARFGPNTGTAYLNGGSGARKYGGASRATFMVTELAP